MKGQPTKPHMFSVCYILITGLPTVRVSPTTSTNKVQNQHTTYTSCPHMLVNATRSHHVVPHCWGTEGIDKHKSASVLETTHTWTCEINIANLHVRVPTNEFNACYLERDWVRRCPGSHDET